MKNVQSISISQSFTYHAEKWVSDSLLVKKEDPFGSRFSKLTVGILSFGAVGLLGIIETLFRSVILALAYTFKKCVPSSLQEWYENKVFIPTKESAERTATATKESFSKIFTNFSPAE